MRKSHLRSIKKAILMILVVQLVFPPGFAAAGGRITGVLKPGQTIGRYAVRAIAPDALPVLRGDTISGADHAYYQDGDTAKLDVHQKQQKIVVDWDSFDIGKDAAVCFDQQGNANWTALNRIYDRNPSQIMGRLSGDGKIFLINQNGFLFGPDASITDMHSFTASALNIAQDALDDQVQTFVRENYQDNPDFDPDMAAEIRNQGAIQVDNGGAIFLMAPRVVNEGEIHAPGGQAALIAGKKVSLFDEKGSASARVEKMVRVWDTGQDSSGNANDDGIGEVINRQGARLTADAGMAGMYGRVVNQDGLVRSVSAVYKNGAIELMASEHIQTGGQSLTTVESSAAADTVTGEYDAGTPQKITLGGLDVGLNTPDLPEHIVHKGAIVADGGQVAMTAEKRVYLESGSNISVAGAHARRSASENEIDVQLNSVELSDDFLAREGALKGARIKVNALTGTDIGNIRGHLNVRTYTARQKHTDGGRVTLSTSAEDGSVVVRKGAGIDFSGGVTHYTGGHVETSRVRLGDKIYDIDAIDEEALQNADKLTLARENKKTYIADYDEGHDAGSLEIKASAVALNGTLKGGVTRGRYQTQAAESGRKVGDIFYTGTRGRREPIAGKLVIGDIAKEPGQGSDRVLDDVVITRQALSLSEDFGWETDLEDGPSVLSADIMNSAGLGSLAVYANKSITTEQGTELVLAPSHGPGDRQGTLEFIANRIVHNGAIRMAGGSVVLHNDYNKTSTDMPNDREGIWLAAGSRIDVSGERWNARNQPEKARLQNHLSGGSITLMGKEKGTSSDSESSGVFVQGGENAAVLDVSGGCYVAPDGDTHGGHAGSLDILGRSVQLDGTLKGHALLGYNGGKVSVAAEQVRVVANGAGAATPSGPGFTMAANRFDRTGFAHITLTSEQGLSVEDGARLSPSETAYIAGNSPWKPLSYVQPPDYLRKPTSVTLVAGASNFDTENNKTAPLRIGEGAAVEVAPGGSISLKGTVDKGGGPDSVPAVSVAGRLTARGGDIAIAAGGDKTGAIVLTDSAVLDASGFTRFSADAAAKGLAPPRRAFAGGSVSLKSVHGRVDMAQGALIDVSGSEAVANTYRHMGTLKRHLTASAAGSLTVAAETIALNGRLDGRTRMPGRQPGGRLDITSTDLDQPYHLTREALDTYITGGASEENQGRAGGGFDALAFRSLKGLVFDGGDEGGAVFANASALRSLVLDAPEIAAAPGTTVDLSATHVVLQNAVEKYKPVITDGFDNLDATVYLATAKENPDGQSQASLNLAGTWLDITGSVALSGFDTVNLTAQRDVRLSDEAYKQNSAKDNYYWRGSLTTYADLTLAAERIHPTTDTTFTIATGRTDAQNNWIGGSLTIADYSPETRLDGPVLSANGTLILKANQIHHKGTLLAPMGRIFLQGTGNDSRITLAAGSVLSTGGDAAVPWGYYDGDRWLHAVKSDTANAEPEMVQAPPERLISVTADTLVTPSTGEQAPLIAVNGGGMVYATEFQSSIAGSANPLDLESTGRYVILPDQSVQLPGEAVYLPGGNGLAAGYYSLLPAEYAYLPGAIVLEDAGAVMDEAIPSYSLGGLPQVVGYDAVMGAGMHGTLARAFVVRSNTDVFREGAYRGQYAVAGDAGTVVVNSTKGDLRVRFSGTGLEGWDGGRAWISSADMVLADTPNPGGDALYIDPELLLGSGFDRTVFGYVDGMDDFAASIGDLASDFLLLEGGGSAFLNNLTETRTLTVAEDTSIATRALGLYAADRVTIEKGASLDTEELVLAAPTGSIDLAPGAAVKTDRLGIFARNMTAGDTIRLGRDDKSRVSVAVSATRRMELVDDTAAGLPDADADTVRIGRGLWSQFGNAHRTALAAGREIATVGAVETGARELLYLNTPVLRSDDLGGAFSGDQSATFTAGHIHLDNRFGAGPGAAQDAAGSATFTAVWDESVVADISRALGGRPEGVDEQTWQAYVEAMAAERHKLGRMTLTGDQTLAGFTDLNLNADRDLVLAGHGSLTTDADTTTLAAGRVTAGGFRRTPDSKYQAADWTVDAGYGALNIRHRQGAKSGQGSTPGGSLAFKAGVIHHAGLIDNFSGGVAFKAQNGIVLEETARILAQGGVLSKTLADETVYQAFRGGWVDFDSGSGDFSMAQGAVVDVSAGAGRRPDGVDQAEWDARMAGWVDDGSLDAGAIAIRASNSDGDLSGVFLGSADAHYTNSQGRTLSARGGSFDLYARTIAFSDINARLGDGGFNRSIALRSRTGDIAVGAGERMHADRIRLSADGGSLAVSGTLDASGTAEDRAIELYARDSIHLKNGSRIDAGGTDGDADGGRVIVAVNSDAVEDLSDAGAPVTDQTDKTGWVIADEGAVIDVAAAGQGRGGKVHFRARQFTRGDGSRDVGLRLAGRIAGAGQILAEAVQRHDAAAGASLNRNQFTTFFNHARNFMNTSGAAVSERLNDQLNGTADTPVSLRPGIEIAGRGDLTVSSDVTLTHQRFGANGDIPGVLTILARGDLTINRSIVDEPHTPGELMGDSRTNDSWNLTLVAGADPSAANPTDVRGGEGDLTVADRALVYTESGDLTLAAGNDISLGQGTLRYLDGAVAQLPTSYTVATHDGDIRIFSGGSLSLAGNKAKNASAIQSATGDIRLDVGGDLAMGANSAIRTSGRSTQSVTRELVADSPYSFYLDDWGYIPNPDNPNQTISVFDAIYIHNLHLLPGDPYYLMSYKADMDALPAGAFDSYAGGGNIDVSVGGDIRAELSENAFFTLYTAEKNKPVPAASAGAGYIYTTGLQPRKPAAGILAMADGNVALDVKGDAGYGDDLYDGLQAGAFGKGDLRIRAGGDIQGRFLVEEGRAAIAAMQNYGLNTPGYAVEVIDSPGGRAVSVDVAAVGDLATGGIIDPILASAWGAEPDNDACLALHYTTDTALRLSAWTGSLTFSGRADNYNAAKLVETALPAKVDMLADRDILFTNGQSNRTWLAPASDGYLNLLAGGSIVGRTTTLQGLRDNTQIILANLAPEQIYYGDALPGETTPVRLTIGDMGNMDVRGDYDGYREAYRSKFNDWYEGQDETVRAAYQARYNQVNDSGYLLHAGDDRPVTVKAGGDIANLALNSPKKVQVTAGGSIRDSYFRMQHIAAGDVSVVAAGKDIVFSPLPVYYSATTEVTRASCLRQSGIEQAGAGAVIVSAGRSVDLGVSKGLRTVGAAYNSALAAEGGSLYVNAGYDAAPLFKDDAGQWSPAKMDDFFSGILEAGKAHSSLRFGQLAVDDDVTPTDIAWVRELGEAYADLVTGYTDYAQVPVAVREQLAQMYLENVRGTLMADRLVQTKHADAQETAGPSESDMLAYADKITSGGIGFDRELAYGRIRMTQSQMFTQQSGKIATVNAGSFDVGISVFSSEKEKSGTGINTMRGGDIDIYTRGDLNVNESRVMTWFGGDIVIWADHGNINAGKGSKTTVSVSKPTKVLDPATGSYTLKYTLPAVGSGIRLLTYDPDGTGGPLEAPEPGNGYFFAPEGEIDAGEAGIVGQGNILLNALVLTNTENIEVAGLSVGATIDSDAGADVGSLSGTGGLDNTAGDSEATALASAQERFSNYVAELSDNLVPKWLAVEVIGFGEEEEDKK